MSKEARLIITAVVVGSSAGEVATTYHVARSWVYELVARYHSEGDTAFEPRSRRPNTSPRTTAKRASNFSRAELVHSRRLNRHDGVVLRIAQKPH